MLGWFLSRISGRASDPLALYHAGAFVEAERLAEERLQKNAADRKASLAQALLLVDRGRGKDAIEIAERLLAPARKDAQAWLVIARAHSAVGRRKAAGEALESAAKLAGKDPSVRAELALHALSEGRVDDAVKHLERVRGAGPRLAKAHSELGADLLHRQQREAAARHLQQAIAANPDDAVAHANLGALRKDEGSFEEAARLLERAVELQPALVEAAFNLAMLRIQDRNWSGAQRLLRDYVAARPRDADAQYWLANALVGDGDVAGARAACQAALRADSQHARARWALVMSQLPAVPMSVAEQQAGLADFGAELDKLALWCRTKAPEGVHEAVGSQQPFFIAYIEDSHRDVLKRYGALCTELMGQWARRVNVPAPAPAHGGKLKVGIVSAHIHSHSVWHALLRGWVEHLDSDRFELQLFHTGMLEDGETKWAAGKVAHLHHDLGAWATWAKAVSDARLDVLVYPEIGMDATTVRLASLRLARVQLAGWGHPVTTGLPTIDGYLSAEAFEPADAQQHYSEKLVALPGLGCSYPPYGTEAEPVDLAEWGIAPDDRLLLAPGQSFKYAPADDALWIAIARRCAPCKLVFFRANDQHAARLERRLRAAFGEAGVDFDAHVRMVPWQTQAAYFALLQRADVFLDTVGFSGFNTTMQAVECGTPIVAWEGRFMRGRFASGILRSLGLGEWVATSHADYADKVARLCADADLRKAVRAKIEAQRGLVREQKASVDALGKVMLEMASRA